MSVSQVEEFYIFISLGGAESNEDCIAELKEYLSENNLDDFEFQESDLVIDGLDCEHTAEGYNDDLRSIIKKHSS